MCFFIPKKGKNSKEQIANKDIVCYKRVNRTKKKDVFRSYWGFNPRFRYKIGRTERIKDFFKSNIRSKMIGRGFHSEMKQDINNLQCIIPKGTRYYKNVSRREYVSLAIKPIREI